MEEKGDRAKFYSTSTAEQGPWAREKGEGYLPVGRDSKGRQLWEGVIFPNLTTEYFAVEGKKKKNAGWRENGKTREKLTNSCNSYLKMTFNCQYSSLPVAREGEKKKPWAYSGKGRIRAMTEREKREEE